MEKKMKQISNANELVRSARKQTHVEQYGSGLVHAISVYQDKDTNKEYLVGMGQLLDNTFELVEVNQNSAIFRNGNKMYRIDNDEEK